ncbi:MAG TPA: M48 family peptidase [Leucothrix mucor]|nr:M48 family peptidase [Leucothrix mucor]
MDTSKQYFIALSANKKYPYQLSPSTRAKRMFLKLSSSGKLCVVFPLGTKENLAHDFVQWQAQWLEKQLNKKKPPLPIVTKPELLDLKMIDEQWSVKYVKGMKNTIEYDELPNKCLQISGAIHSDQLVQKIIGLFLKNQARVIFPSKVAEIATFHDFRYSDIKIRGQKGRWGSCSSHKTLNLNYKLLFMPEHVASYVFIHELCHTVEMNHSVKFWQLVERCNPEYKKHEKYLKEHGSIIRYF